MAKRRALPALLLPLLLVVLTGCEGELRLTIERPQDQILELPLGAAFIQGWVENATELRVRIKTDVGEQVLVLYPGRDESIVVLGEETTREIDVVTELRASRPMACGRFTVCAFVGLGDVTIQLTAEGAGGRKATTARTFRVRPDAEAPAALLTEVRRDALGFLPRKPSASTFAFCREALADPHWVVRCDALRALGRWLRAEKREAVTEAPSVRTPAMIQTMVGLLYDERWRVVRQTMRVLDAIGPAAQEAVVGRLAKDLAPSATEPRDRAVTALAGWLDLDDSRDRTRDAAMRAREDEIVSHLMELLQGGGGADCPLVLWRFGPQAQEAVVGRVIEHERSGVPISTLAKGLHPVWRQGLAATLLARKPEIFEPVWRGLRRGREETRREMAQLAWHLGPEGRTRYFDALEEDGALHSGRVLASITGDPWVWCTCSRQVDQQIRRLLRAKDAAVRHLGAYIAYRWRGDEARLRAALGELEMSENPELREMAAYGMPLLGREHAILRLRAMLEDDVERVRVEAAWQLGKLGE